MDKQERTEGRVAIYKRIHDFYEQLRTIHADARYFLDRRAMTEIENAGTALGSAMTRIEEQIVSDNCEGEQEFVRQYLKGVVKE